MLSQTAPYFQHRWNSDGSYDTICLKCFITVANVRTEAELVEFDGEHVCNSDSLARRYTFVAGRQV